MRLNLNKILESRGMSLIELSKLSGLGRTTLSELNNTNTLPEKTKVETLIKLCSALKITMETLVETEKGSFKIKDKNYISEIKDFSADLLFQYDKEFFSQTFQLGIYAQKEIGSESKQKLYEERLRLEKKYTDILNKKYDLKIPYPEFLDEYLSKSKRFEKERQNFDFDRKMLEYTFYKTDGFYKKLVIHPNKNILEKLANFDESSKMDLNDFVFEDIYHLSKKIIETFSEDLVIRKTVLFYWIFETSNQTHFTELTLKLDAKTLDLIPLTEFDINSKISLIDYV